MGPKLRGIDVLRSDDDLASAEVAPSISVTSTFKHEQGAGEILNQRNPTRHIYSRYTQHVNTRVEHVLSRILGGYAITYASGIAAAYAAMVFYQPRRVCITGGYHGVHASIQVFQRCRNGDLKVVGIDDEFKEGDLCWLETPENPTGESKDIKYYAEKVHAVGGHLLVDSTFGPPPLQDPFKWGADCVMHSGTKYLGGHSDLLSGALVVKTSSEWDRLQVDRTFLGSVMGSLESWLLLRSLRTLHLRVPRQSETATGLAQWLNSAAAKPAGESFDGIPGGIITKVWHSSLQKKDARGFEPKTQLEGGWNATFAILLANTKHASQVPYSLKNFTAATSLGGVETLIEQRLLSDRDADPRLIRISVGLEDLEDLKDDLRSAFRGLALSITTQSTPNNDQAKAKL